MLAHWEGMVSLLRALGPHLAAATTIAGLSLAWVQPALGSAYPDNPTPTPPPLYRRCAGDRLHQRRNGHQHHDP
jgi:hypothetical protein